MKNIFVIICYIILPVFSLTEIAPKLCINCKFFRNNFLTDNKFGRCYLFPTEEKRDINYYVTGIEKNVEFYYCSTARNYDDMCGKEGKKYINLSEDRRLKCKKV
jgi:hypothetical protein